MGSVDDENQTSEGLAAVERAEGKESHGTRDCVFVVQANEATELISVKYQLRV